MGEGGWAVSFDGGVWPIMHGNSGGKPITLIDCRVTSSRSNMFSSFEAPHEQTIMAQHAVVGTHLLGADEPVLARVNCLIEDALAWSGTSALAGKLHMEHDRLSGNGSIDVSRIEPEVAKVGDLTVEIMHWTQLPDFDRRRGGTTGSVRDAVVFGIEPAQPFSLLTALEQMRSIQDLIALASGRAPAFLWLTGYLPRDQSGNDGRRLDLYLRDRGLGDPDAKARSKHEFVFTVDDVPIQKLLVRWWEVQRKFSATCNIILGSRFSSEVYIETSIINAVTAAEAMHKALDEPWPIPKEELQALIALAVEAMPEDRKEWMRNFIPWGHSLRKRLDSLASRIPEKARARLLPDPSAWAKAAVKARNGLSHSGKSSAEIDHLYAVVRVTQAVVILNLLVELALTEERILKALDDNRELSYSCHLSASHFSPSTTKSTNGTGA